MANLRIAELDFDAIKTNLKNYLKSQSEFTDYDFEGSSISILLDILAYNTHYNAYLANMLANEMFLDSAVKRESAVSIAKHLGYITRSVKGASAVVDITVNSPSGSPSSLTLPKFTSFSTIIDGSSYSFLNTEAKTINPENGVYTFNDVSITEGIAYSFRFTVVDPGPTEKYEIPNANLDTNTLSVTVQTSASDFTVETYTKVDNITDLDGYSKVFYLEENTKEKYEIYFGDGILGKKLNAGNIVIINYLVSSGTIGNVSSEIDQSFSYSGTINGGTVTVTTVSNSTGGANKESITEIKFNAPKAYSSLDRAVTLNDYETLIRQYYPYAESISVWGGEDNIPPKYGKVIISLKPYSGFTISDSVKEDIKNNLLKNKQVVGITPEFVDPNYIHVGLEVYVKYNSKLTTFSSSNLTLLIQQTIEDYFRLNLQKFDNDFYHGKILNDILDIDTAILSCNLVPKLQLRITPTLGQENSYILNYKLKFSNRILPNSLTSTVFYITNNAISTKCYLKDVAINSTDYDGVGVISLYNYDTDLKLLENIGSINYATGDLSIDSITPEGYYAGQSDLRITAKIQPGFYDILSNKEQVLLLDNSTQDTNNNRFKGLDISLSIKND